MPLIKFPSEGEPTKEVTAPVIVTTDGKEVVHEDAVTQIPKSVADHIINGDVDPDATDKGGTKSVTDQIITGLTEANPSRDEGVGSVSEHVITGEVANGATDDGALQSPGLPVEVTSGKVGPDAVYDPQNWGGTLVWCYTGNSVGSITNVVFGNGEGVGDVLVVTAYYGGTDWYASPTFTSEVNLNRIFYLWDQNLLGSDWGHFFGMWEVTGAFGSGSDLDVALDPSAAHQYGLSIITGFSEFY